MLNLLSVMLGGALGSGLRYLVTLACQPLMRGFPLGTLIVNVAGCLFIGLAGFAFIGAAGIRENYRLALIVGVFGGFTTFSSFAFETMRLANEGQMARAILNIAATNALCFAAVVLGYRLAQRMLA